MINSRQKGARVERKLRDLFREHGFIKAHRGQQYCGAKGNSDVVVPEIPGIHPESKGVKQAATLCKWMAQADRDAAGESDITAKIPIVFIWPNNSRPMALTWADHQIELLRRSDLVEPNKENNGRVRELEAGD